VLEHKERVSLRILYQQLLKILKINLEPITVFEIESENGLRTNGVVKLNQYTATPYEVALFPTHRQISELVELSTQEA